jgi:hypothetical protein
LYIGYIKVQTQAEHCGASRGAAMPDIVLNIAEVDERIAAVRENLRQLVEQAAASPGAADTPSAVAPAIFRTSRRVLFDLRMMASSGVA